MEVDPTKNSHGFSGLFHKRAGNHGRGGGGGSLFGRDYFLFSDPKHLRLLFDPFFSVSFYRIRNVKACGKNSLQRWSPVINVTIFIMAGPRGVKATEKKRVRGVCDVGRYIFGGKGGRVGP